MSSNSAANQASFYQTLLTETATSQQYLLDAPIIADVLSGKFTLATYAAFLNQAYHHVKHTAPLLMTAGGNLGPDQVWLQKTISDYVAEELGHEAWILDDLEACGFDRQTFQADAAPFHSEILVSFLYDYVSKKNPVGIFGMVLVLEGTSASLAPTVAKIVQEKLALPDTAMTYLRTHGELDQEHMGFFEQAMNKITAPADQLAIIHVANRVYQLYGDIYRAIPVAAERFTEQASAA